MTIYAATMDGQQWIHEFAQRLGITPLSEADTEALLDIASVAAHSSERLAAPLTCFLIGQSGMPIVEARAIADQIAADQIAAEEQDQA